MTSGLAGKLLIFDCDGTLVDSELLCDVALETCLRAAGVVEPAASLLLRYRGAKLAGIVSDIEARHGVSLPPGFVDGYRAETERVFARELRATEGMADALERLASAGARMCVASSGPVAKITQSLALTDLARFFGDRVYSAYVVGRWKPDPGLFLHAASRQGVGPGDCIVIEDSLPGIEAARHAGMPFLLYHPQPSPDEAPPKGGTPQGCDAPPEGGSPQGGDAPLVGGARFTAMAALPALLGA